VKISNIRSIIDCNSVVLSLVPIGILLLGSFSHQHNSQFSSHAQTEIERYSCDFFRSTAEDFRYTKYAIQSLFSFNNYCEPVTITSDNEHGGDDEKDNSIPGGETPTLTERLLKPELVFRGLEFPTNMAFLGPNDILVLEKNKGTVQRIVNGVKLEEPLLDVNVATLAERGMLGIAIAKNHSSINDTSSVPITHVFLYFTESSGRQDGDDSKNGTKPLGNRLYRYELVDNKLVNPKLILDLPANLNRHNGGPILIGPDQNVYLAIGDINHTTKAQNYEDGHAPDGTGGILRITKDGEAVSNIVFGEEDPLNKYYAYGIRNSFGMDFDPVTGKLWDTENGLSYGDEINLVEPGFNSGWSRVQGIWQSNGSDWDSRESDWRSGQKEEMLLNKAPDDLVDFNGKGEYSNPEFVWEISVAPTAIKFFNSSNYGKQYENDMFVGDFNNGNIYHFDLNENRTSLILNGDLADKVASSEEELDGVLFGQDLGGITALNTLYADEGFAGITDIEVGDDGYLYVLTFHENQGAIFRIVPAI
jgi:aldose sugar dehydrogenase